MQKRPSIKDIFSGWNRMMLILLTMLLLLSISTISNESSIRKSANLTAQKKLVNTIATIGRGDLEVANVQYRGKSTEINHLQKKLYDLQKFDLLGQYILTYDKAYKKNLATLTAYTIGFNQAASDWYARSEDDLNQRYQALQSAYHQLNDHLNAMLLANIGYDTQKYEIQKWMLYATLLITLYLFYYYSGRFRTIINDINSLYVETKGSDHAIVTDEIDVITKRLHRKTGTFENPALIDPMTGINNYKGMLQSYTGKKSKNGASLVSIAVFEIDAFQDLKQQYPKSFIEAVLKKAAFMLSLHEQPTDVLARIDYNRFAVIFSRRTVEDAFEECEKIRKAIEDTAFKIPKGDTIHLTVSGGLTIKDSTTPLEEAIEFTHEILTKGQGLKPNTIYQTKDVVSA